MKVCAVIPAFNEEATIGLIVQETQKYVDLVVVVDDASADNTAEIARQNEARVIRRLKNRGPGTALQALLNPAERGDVDYTTFDFIVHIDSDGQHDPKYIPRLLEVAQNCDMVIASRFLNSSYKNYTPVRKIGISFFTFLVNFINHTNLTDVTSGFRVYRTSSLKKLSLISTRHWAIEQTMQALKRGLIIKEVSVEMPVRASGDSQFNFSTYISYPLKMVWVIIKVLLFR